MQSKKIKHLSQLSIYKKALEIFALTRRIVAYITYDKDILSIHQSTSKLDRYADNLVMKTLLLAPKIAEIENEKSISAKLQLAKSFENTVLNINRTCGHLEYSKASGIDYIKLLKEEIKKLQSLYKNYVNSIVKA